MLFHLLQQSSLGVDVETDFVIGARFHRLEVDNGCTVGLLADKLCAERLGVVAEQTGGIGDVIVGVGHGCDDYFFVGLVKLPHGFSVAVNLQVGSLDAVTWGIVENVHLMAEGLLLVGIEVDNGDGETDRAGHLGGGFLQQGVGGLVHGTFIGVGNLCRQLNAEKDGYEQSYCSLHGSVMLWH